MYKLISRVTSVLAISLPVGLSKKVASSSLILVGFTNPLGARLAARFLFLLLFLAETFSSLVNLFSKARYSDLRPEITAPNCCNLEKNSVDWADREVSSTTTGATDTTSSNTTTGAERTSTTSSVAFLAVAFLAAFFSTTGATEAEATDSTFTATDSTVGAGAGVAVAVLTVFCLDDIL